MLKKTNIPLKIDKYMTKKRFTFLKKYLTSKEYEKEMVNFTPNKCMC